jgi:hypothetical protein
MKFRFLFLLLTVICFGMIGAEVSENNYFKYGESDVFGNLIETGNDVSGVQVTGFVCGDYDCSYSAGDWVDEYVAGNSIILSYPTTLQSSYGYGYWSYKSGYIPFYSLGTTYYGTWDAPDYDVYLSKKTECISDLSVKDIAQGGKGSLSFDVEFDSPMENLYGNMYVPSTVSGHLRSVVEVNVEVLDSYGMVAWSDVKHKAVDYGGLESVSFSKDDFGDGRYDVRVWTSSVDESQCLISSNRSSSFKFDTGVLDIVDVTCFDDMIVGHNQSCSVSVKDKLGNPVGGAFVEFYYEDDYFFAGCTTDSISGACSAKDIQDKVGDFKVHAVAKKDGYDADRSEDVTFEYRVWKEGYNIVGLSTWSDENFLNESYEFYRGESLYASFKVLDISREETNDNLVSNVSLVSSAGVHIALDFIRKDDSNSYFYKLDEVPLTHDFIGDSNVFSFVFNMEDSSGGQEEIELMIRNNLPSPSVIPDKTVDEGRNSRLDLVRYEYDMEDSGSALRWEVVSFGSKIDVVLEGKELVIKGKRDGEDSVLLRLYDLDGDYGEVSFVVDVSDNGDSDSCTARWSCSSWSKCDGGVERQICVDDNACDANERVVNIQKCVSNNIDYYKGVVMLNDMVKEGSGFLLAQDIVTLFTLCCLIVLIMLLIWRIKF